MHKNFRATLKALIVLYIINYKTVKVHMIKLEVKI